MGSRGKRLPSLQTRKDILIKSASEYNPEKISDVFVRALTPFWDWMIRDYGLKRLLES